MTTNNAPDWASLLALATEQDIPLSDEELDLWRRGLIDGSSRMWAVDYVHAVQRAVTGNDTTQLRAMLDAGIQPPAFLLSLIARAFDPTPNRPAKLTSHDDDVIRQYFDRATTHMGMTPVEAKRWLVESRRITRKTLDRSLARTAKHMGQKYPTV